jgi:outer membrane protein assembly factor BamA
VRISRQWFSRAAILICLLSVSALSAQQQPADATFALEAVNVAGLKRYTSEQAVKLSGLTIGAPVRLSELVAAAKRMADTGMFASVSYRYTTLNNRITVTLDVEEAKWTHPVVFDNFVWMTEADLTMEVSQDMPTFDGTVPPTDNARNHLTQALQKALRSRNLPGTVEVVPHLNMITRAQQYVAKVTNPSPRVCTVSVTGTSPAMERDVKSITDSLTGTDFSKSYMVGMSSGTLTNLYRKQGYWAAGIGVPVATVDPGCGGVNVTLAIDEGLVYRWEGVDWIGNASIPADQLTPLLQFRDGDLADVNKLDAGIRRVRDSYGRLGHLTAAVAYVPKLTAETKKVRFALEVKEGPQYRMGALLIAGLPPKDAANLEKKWKLKPGDVFNTAVALAFDKEDLIPFLKQHGYRLEGVQVRQSPTPMVVDVTITARK